MDAVLCEKIELWREALHIQIARSLQEMIDARQLLPGDKLPTIQELAEIFEVSQSTLQKAMRLLRQRGLIQAMASRGTFVQNNSTR